MKFDDLDAQMRVYETANDHVVLPGIYMVARIDGRGFTKLTKDRHKFEAPFDIRFRDMMIETTKHLMECGCRIIYGYTQSDEISLLFHRDDGSFSRKLRKLNSIFAGEASAKFSLQLGALAAFDCRICQLPNPSLVRDYFRWRQEDAARNALNAHCYWMRRKAGDDERSATQVIEGISVADKNELLFQNGINFNDLPAWQKRGIGLVPETYEKEGFNPVTGQSATALRRRIRIDFDLPFGQEYGRMIEGLLEAAHI